MYFKGGYQGVSVGYRQGIWPGCIGICGCWFRMSPSPLGLCSELPGTWVGWCLEQVGAKPLLRALYHQSVHPAHYAACPSCLVPLFEQEIVYFEAVLYEGAMNTSGIMETLASPRLASESGCFEGPQMLCPSGQQGQCGLVSHMLT